MPLSPIQSHLNSARMSNPNYFRCNIYAVQQDTQSVLMSLFITYVSSTCFGPHRSIIRSVLQAVFADLVLVIRVLLDTSSRYEVVGRTNIRDE